MKKEIFKNVVWYEWLYQISNLGRVKSLKYWKEKILKHQIWKSKYIYYNLCKDNICQKYYSHRLIWQAFIPNLENKPHINHKNWIKSDNRLENLEWITSKENHLHRFQILWQKWALKWKFWKLHHWAKRVNQYTKEWEFIKTWDSMADIQREIWINQRRVSDVCLWKINYIKWFKFKFC
jgi:hypothetical protein